MKIVKFIIDQKKEVIIYCSYIPRMGESVIINKKCHFVDDVIYDSEKAEIQVYLLSQE